MSKTVTVNAEQAATPEPPHGGEVKRENGIIYYADGYTRKERQSKPKDGIVIEATEEVVPDLPSIRDDFGLNKSAVQSILIHNGAPATVSGILDRPTFQFPLEELEVIGNYLVTERQSEIVSGNATAKDFEEEMTAGRNSRTAELWRFLCDRFTANPKPGKTKTVKRKVYKTAGGLRFEMKTNLNYDPTQPATGENTPIVMIPLQ